MLKQFHRILNNDQEYQSQTQGIGAQQSLSPATSTQYNTTINHHQQHSYNRTIYDTIQSNNNTNIQNIDGIITHNNVQIMRQYDHNNNMYGQVQHNINIGRQYHGQYADGMQYYSNNGNSNSNSNKSSMINGNVKQNTSNIDWQILSTTQNLILQAFQQLFANNINLQFLHSIYEDVLGKQVFNSEDKLNNTGKQITISVEQQLQINCRLLQAFIVLIKQKNKQNDKESLISLQSYQKLEQQTQKSQQIIRSHIKLQQEMKIYMEYLERKCQDMDKYIHKINNNINNKQMSIKGVENMSRQIQILQVREKLLQKQKITLIKSNQKLKQQVQTLTSYINRQIKARANMSISRNNANQNTIFQNKKRQNTSKSNKKSSRTKSPAQLQLQKLLHQFENQHDNQHKLYDNSLPISKNASRYLSSRNSPARKSQIHQNIHRRINKSINKSQHQDPSKYEVKKPIYYPRKNKTKQIDISLKSRSKSINNDQYSSLIKQSEKVSTKKEQKKLVPNKNNIFELNLQQNQFKNYANSLNYETNNKLTNVHNHYEFINKTKGQTINIRQY